MKITESQLRRIIRSTLNENIRNFQDEDIDLELMVGWMREHDEKLRELDDRIDTLEFAGSDIDDEGFHKGPY